MKLEKIIIENYKSIEYVEFDIIDVDGSNTFSLLGINESGKSSFLKAISLVAGEEISFPIDYFDQNNPVKILFQYSVYKDMSTLTKELTTKHKFPKELIEKTKINKLTLIAEFSPNQTIEKNFYEEIEFEYVEFKEYTLKENSPVKKEKEESEIENFNLQAFFKNYLKGFFWSESHDVVLWTPEPKYLILDDIDLAQFAASPETSSIPLLNCFILAGIEGKNIRSEIEKLTSAVTISSLQSRLSELTTTHIIDG